jgi:dolichol-phosphate mannosyltransferase
MRNEAPLVDELIRRVEETFAASAASFEMIAVDDGSDDDTWQRLRAASPGRPWLKGMRLSCGFGQHPATFAGLAAASGAVIVSIDADLQCRPEDVPLLLERIRAGADLVYGRRGHEGEGFLRETLGAAVRDWLSPRLAGAGRVTPSTFLAARREVVQRALAHRRARPVTPWHMLLGSPRRVESVAVPGARRPRGRGKYSLLRLARLSADILLGYSGKAEALLALAAGFAPAGTLVLWLVALGFAFGGGEVLGMLFFLAGAMSGLAALALAAFLVGALVLRRVPPDEPLYAVTETF